MKPSQVRLLYPALLLLYSIGRILQLFAGTVPDLLIVALHVLPPAIFALVHGARSYGTRGVLVFSSLCLGTATVFESMSLRTGFPFGRYYFTNLMGPAIAGLPILLAVAYLGMGYLSWVVALAMLGEEKPLEGNRILLAPLLASAVMTAWDLSMEAVWADIDQAWVWRGGGLWFGVPLSNFFGWLLTTYVFYQLFGLYLRHRATAPAGRSKPAITFYALSALGNLLVIAPLSRSDIFLDTTGKPWSIAHILWASRLVSVLVMLPCSLFAWLKVFRTARTRNAEPS